VGGLPPRLLCLGLLRRYHDAGDKVQPPPPSPLPPSPSPHPRPPIPLRYGMSTSWVLRAFFLASFVAACLLLGADIAARAASSSHIIHFLLLAVMAAGCTPLPPPTVHMNVTWRTHANAHMHSHTHAHTLTPALTVGSMRRESDSGYAPTPLDLAHISFDDDDDLQLLQVHHRCYNLQACVHHRCYNSQACIARAAACLTLLQEGALPLVAEDREEAVDREAGNLPPPPPPHSHSLECLRTPFIAVALVVKLLLRCFCASFAQCAHSLAMLQAGAATAARASACAAS